MIKFWQLFWINIFSPLLQDSIASPRHPHCSVPVMQKGVPKPNHRPLKFRINGTDTWKNVRSTVKLCHPPRPTEPRGRTYEEWEKDCTWGTQTYIMMVKRKKTIGIACPMHKVGSLIWPGAQTTYSKTIWVISSMKFISGRLFGIGAQKKGGCAT